MSQGDFVQRGVALVSQGDYQEAVKTCRLGLLSRPGAVDGRIVLGRALLALGRYDEVLHEMRVALEAAPSEALAYMLRGEALLRKGEYQPARAALRLARGLAPAQHEIAALIEEVETVTSQVNSAPEAPDAPDAPDPTSLYRRGEVRDETETKHYPRASGRGAVPAVGTPALARQRPPSATETESARAGPQEDTLLVPLSSPAAPGHSTENGWSSAVAKKHNTEPLSDDALVEVPVAGGPQGRAAVGRGPGVGPAARPPLPRPTKPPFSAPGGGGPPPLPGAALRSGPLPPPPSSPPPPPAPWAQPTMAPSPPPPQPPPLGAQRAGAFQAYQTGIAAQPPAAPPQARQAPRAPGAPAPHQGQQAAGMPMAAGPVAPAAAAPGRSAAPARSRRKPRTGLATALWVLVGAAVIGGGVLAGFQIRDLRLRRQIEAAERRGQESSASDAWLGWRVARDGLVSIAAARRTLESRIALARAQALISFELGDGGPQAAAALRAIGPDPRAAVARAYMALVAGDAVAAAREVNVAAADGGATVDYLRGRVALLTGDARAALAAFEKAHRAEPRPFFAVGLAQAHGALDRWDAADKVLASALAKHPDHPALTLTRVSLATNLGRLDAAAGAAALTQLDRVIAEGDKPPAAQSGGVSPWQQAMALLLKARLQISRGDRAAALASLARALELGVDEQRFAEASVGALVAVDLLDVAASTAKRGLTAWPQSVILRVESARSLFASGRLAEVVEALPDALIARDPDALALRARARLILDDVEAARRDLELVPAATTPALSTARALLKLAQGEPIEDQPPSQRVDSLLVQARAARQRGEGAKAVTLLRPLLERPQGAERFAVRLELARSYRDAADYAGARAAYNDLMSSPNPQLRLETAQLLLEDRDPRGAREHIEALLRDQGDKATGLMLVEAMRIRTLTGAPVEAESLAARAAAAGAPPWMLQREAARIARRRDDLAAAADALSKALDGSKADLDTLFMACDVVDAAAPAQVAKLSKAVDERLVGQPDQLVAQGKLALARGDIAKATELFDKAAQRFKERPASARRLAQVSFGAGALAVGRNEWVMARSKLEAAIGLDPSLIDAYTYLAVALNRIGELPRAVALLKNAAELAPESKLVWETLADYATTARDPKTAAEAQKRAAALARHK